MQFLYMIRIFCVLDYDLRRRRRIYIYIYMYMPLHPPPPPACRVQNVRPFASGTCNDSPARKSYPYLHVGNQTATPHNSNPSPVPTSSHPSTPQDINPAAPPPPQPPPRLASKSCAAHHNSPITATHFQTVLQKPPTLPPSNPFQNTKKKTNA
jgi:hypothetical protein